MVITVQAACVLGEVMDANPAGNNTDHAGTATVAARTQEASRTEAAPEQAGPSPTVNAEPSDEPGMAGQWHGTAQWLCGDNPTFKPG